MAKKYYGRQPTPADLVANHLRRRGVDLDHLRLEERLAAEKDRAKRYAGQYIYLVLMQYVKLHLAGAVPRGVREALEPGVYSVLDVTTADGMKIMNDAMDPSGRVIFKDMFKLYQRFGKWSGV